MESPDLTVASLSLEFSSFSDSQLYSCHGLWLLNAIECLSISVLQDATVFFGRGLVNSPRLHFL